MDTMHGCGEARTRNHSISSQALYQSHIIQKHFELSIELFTKYSDFFPCLLYAYMTMSYNKHQLLVKQEKIQLFHDC